MIVFPLKWLPWILAVGGFIVFVTTGDPGSLVSLIIGGVWLYFIFSKKKEKTGTGSTTSHRAPVQSTTTVPKNVNTANTVVCPTCSTAVGEGMSFCTKCGTKVR
jgi:hypothetical protein